MPKLRKLVFAGALGVAVAAIARKLQGSAGSDWQSSAGPNATVPPVPPVPPVPSTPTPEPEATPEPEPVPTPEPTPDVPPAPQADPLSDPLPEAAQPETGRAETDKPEA